MQNTGNTNERGHNIYMNRKKQKKKAIVVKKVKKTLAIGV